jgi:diguanylate cyclase (GGDEF)-like protein
VALLNASGRTPLPDEQGPLTPDPLPALSVVPRRGPLLPELARRSRATGLLVTALATLVATVWAGFDQVLEPVWADSFLTVRLLGDVPMLTCLWLLWRRPVGRRHPGALAFGALAVVQVEVAWMVVRVAHLEYYLLGFSLALYCSGTLLTDRPRWTGALIGTSWAALAVAALTAPAPVSRGELVAASFFLGTASLVSMLAHHRRWQLAVGELAARLRLEQEQDRTRALLVRLERLSNQDPLTGLANRRRWDDELARACARAAHGSQQLTLLLLDVDHFKRINDEYGHPAGDAALRALADLLRAHVRPGDLAARIGGDELAVLLPGADLDRAVILAEQLREAAQLLRPEGFRATGVSVSMGVATSGLSGADPEALLAAADTQLYLAKQTRNAVRAPGFTAG